MSGANTFGKVFRITSFGESHGPALGAVVEGCPAGVPFDSNLLKRELLRRRPGIHTGTSMRKEADLPQVLSGVYEGKTLGTPIAITIANEDQRPADYANSLKEPRVGHADDVWLQKFGHSDPRGGGRASGRETVARVLGGSIAQMFLRTQYPELRIQSRLVELGGQFCNSDPLNLNVELVGLLESIRDSNDSLGAVLELRVDHAPVGLGQPVFHKFKADLAAALMSVGATTSFEIGGGLRAAALRGSEMHKALNDATYGGIRGGITTGDPILVRVGIKPTSSIGDVAKRGRHDPCIAIRASVVLEHMVWLTLADHVLLQRLDRA